MHSKTNITTIGGGTGTFNVLLGLKKNPHLNLAAIVSVSDSGGSTGELRDQFWILPPGDIRRAIVALSDDTEVVRRLFEYRFKKESRIGGHTVGNLLLTALTDITGTFESGIQELCDMFDVRGKVIPVTLDNTHLGVVLENGEEIIGETNIDVPKHDGNLAIKDAFLIGGGSINPRATEVLLNSDIIVIWPGDLYTSIVPNLLVKGMPEAIKKSHAKVVYVCNVMTKHGETNNFFMEDFVEVIEKYIGKGRVDYVVLNSGKISPDLVKKYSEEENKRPVYIREPENAISKTYRIIERDLLNEDDFIRHNPMKLRAVIEDFVHGWIK